jgi:hypothetical protein
MVISFVLAIILFQDLPVVYSKRYDNVSSCVYGNEPCTLIISVDKKMPAPIYFSYQLVNFYQSHRVYLNSRSNEQLRGDVLNSEGCSPSSTFNGKIIYPCGLLPQSIFTDRFFIDVERDGTTTKLCSPSSCPRYEHNISWPDYWDLFHEDGTWERTGAWGGLADSKYELPDEFPSAVLYTRKSPFLNSTNLQLPNPSNPDMIVWLRTAVGQTFKKPYRVIKDYDLLEGDKVYVHYFDYFFAGEKAEKYFYLESLPGLGLHSMLIGCMCLAIGFFSLCMFPFIPIVDYCSKKEERRNTFERLG